jgi:pimeloyl-ACP methyl ester carboxylesterase
MTAPAFLETPQGRRIAHHRTPGNGTGVVFLGGFRSDMEGTKALHLEAWAKARGRAFLRFDYSGHGQSSGAFEDGCDRRLGRGRGAAIDALTEGPQILVGSSMGGWIALLLASRRRVPDRGARRHRRRARLHRDDGGGPHRGRPRAALAARGRIERPSDYAPEPYVFTRRLFEDGRRNLVLDAAAAPALPRHASSRAPPTPMSTRRTVALRLLDHATGPDIRLTLVKDADHRFSTPECLALIEHERRRHRIHSLTASSGVKYSGGPTGGRRGQRPLAGSPGHRSRRKSPAALPRPSQSPLAPC